MWRKDAVYGLLWAVGLAAAAVGMLLWGADRGAVRSSADVAVQRLYSEPVEATSADGALPGASEQRGHALHQDSVGNTWVSTKPVTTMVSSSAYQVWSIAQYGVTITFYENSVPLVWWLFPELQDSVVPLAVTAVFTFTPRETASVGLGVVPSHVFDLEGRYSWGGPVSMNDFDIALQYTEDDLGETIEPTLRFYYYDTFARKWGVVQSGSLDMVHNVIECTTDETGQFAVAGNQFQVFLPLALRR